MSFLSTMAAGAMPAALVALVLVSGVRDAHACGGCFHPQVEQGGSVVTDHRMVFKISTRETVLWDQVRYAGDPKEFAWVLPVHAGATVELSRDAFIGALDSSTRTSVRGPEIFCSPAGGVSPRSSSGGGGGGCSSSETTSADAPASESNAGAPKAADAGSFAGNESVEVVSQEVIGPYQAVTIRASHGEGISAWLTTNGFAIPTSVAPVVDSYTKEGFDFIALRLRPDQGVRAMRPIRIVSPGADTTMPLRMVAAGVGAKVGMTLWVIGEGRYHPQNFPDAPIDWTQLAWSATGNRSNLSELVPKALAANGGRSWLTEAAVRTTLEASATFGTSPSVYNAYMQQCLGLPSRRVPCDETALPPADGSPEVTTDGGAGDDDAGAADAGPEDASAPPACTKIVSGCDGFDDLDVAARDIHTSDIWITRLRADLPVSALDQDLRLEAAPAQLEDSPQRRTSKFTEASFDPCASVRANGANASFSTPSGSSGSSGGCTCRTTPLEANLGTWFVIGLGAVGASLASRRRRR